MIKSELIERSPLRILEKSIHGGVGIGNIGLITSKPGVGKTACLVHIAIDKLFQDKHVIHLSFADRTDHIVDWYESLFYGIAQRRNLEKASEIYDTIIKNRVIMNFNLQGLPIEQILRSIEALISDGHFTAEVIVIDGLKLKLAGIEILQALRGFAQEHKLTVWASADTQGGDPLSEAGHIMEEISVHIHLQNLDNHIELGLIKDHEHQIEGNLQLKLDPNTLLISK